MIEPCYSRARLCVSYNRRPNAALHTAKDTDFESAHQRGTPLLASGTGFNSSGCRSCSCHGQTKPISFRHIFRSANNTIWMMGMDGHDRLDPSNHPEEVSVGIRAVDLVGARRMSMCACGCAHHASCAFRLARRWWWWSR